MLTDFPDYLEQWNQSVTNCNGWGGVGINSLVSTNLDGTKTDVLLYRNLNLELLGILQYFSMEVPIINTKKGNINLFVNPKYFRTGIGSTLLREAMKRWNVDLSKQLYTLSGYGFIKSFLK